MQKCVFESSKACLPPTHFEHKRHLAVDYEISAAILNRHPHHPTIQFHTSNIRCQSSVLLFIEVSMEKLLL